MRSDEVKQPHYIVIGIGNEGQWAVLNTHKNEVVGAPFRSHADAAAAASAYNRTDKGARALRFERSAA